MKKVLLLILILINSFLLTSCLTFDETIEEKYIILEKNNFIIVNDKLKTNDSKIYYYRLIGLTDEARNNDTIVFPQKIDGVDATNIGYYSSLFGFNTQIKPFILYKQKNIFELL